MNYIETYLRHSAAHLSKFILIYVYHLSGVKKDNFVKGKQLYSGIDAQKWVHF